LLLLVYIYVLGVYDFAFFLTAATVCVRLWTRPCCSGLGARPGRSLWLGPAIHLLGQLVRSLGEGIAGPSHLVLIVTLERLLGVGYSVFNVTSLRAGDLVTVLAKHFLYAIHQGVELIAGIDFLPLGFVFRRVSVRFFGHAFHFFLAEAGRRGNGDLLVLLRRRVLGGHVQDAVGINVERHLNLRHAAWSGWNAGQVKLAERAIVARQRSLTLQHVHLYRRLAIGSRGESLRLARRNRRVARDHGSRHPTQRFDREGQRSHIQEQQVFNLALEDATLNGRTHCHHFIRINSLVTFFTEQLLHQLLNTRHARLATDQHYFVDLVRGDASIFHALLARAHRALNDVFHHLLEFATSETLHQMLRAAGIGSNKGQVDLGLHGGGEFNLLPLGRVTQTLESHLVALGVQIQAFILLEFVYEPVHDALVDVVATQVGVAIRGLNLNDAFADLENRNVEGAAPE